MGTQVCKLLSGAPEAVAHRGWLLLCMCVELFSPSVEFELFLLNFVLAHRTHRTWGDYAEVSSLGDAKSSLGDAKSSLGDAKSSLGDAKSSLGDAMSSLGDAESSLGDD
jgi:hypothetical protein